MLIRVSSQVVQVVDLKIFVQQQIFLMERALVLMNLHLVYILLQCLYTWNLLKNGAAASIMESGAVMKTAFCGPCFGAGDTPS